MKFKLTITSALKNRFSPTIKMNLLVLLFSMIAFNCSDDSKTLDRDKFISTYSSVDNCPSGTGNSVITISTSALTDNAVLITNLLGLMSGTGLPAVNGSVNGNNLTIPNQNFALNGQTVIISGTGILNNTVLNLTITYSFNGATETCSHVATKQ